MHESKAGLAGEEKGFTTQKRILRTSGLASHHTDQKSFKQLSKNIVQLKQNLQAAALTGSK